MGNFQQWFNKTYPPEKIEEEGVRRGRETAEYLKSLGYMGGKKDKECQHIDLEEKTEKNLKR